MLRCNACGTVRTNETIAWSKLDLNTYCGDESLCNEKHPGNENMTRDRSELMEGVLNNPEISSQTLILLKKMYIEPVTARLEPFQIAYLLKLQSAAGYKSMNETLKEIINGHMVVNPEITKLPLTNIKVNWKITDKTARRIMDSMKKEEVEQVKEVIKVDEDRLKKQAAFEAYKLKIAMEEKARKEEEAKREAERQAAERLAKKIEERKDREEIENITGWTV